MKRARGFTLMELMIVVAVVAILATLALSSYSKQVRKSRRAEAKQVLSDLVLKQEKWRSNHTAYGTVAQIGGAASSTYYSICPVVATCTTSASSYVLTAVPLGDQLSDSCGTMKVTMAAGSLSKTSSAGSNCW